MGGIRALSLIRIPESGGSGSGVSSFNTRTGAVTLQSSDVTTALGWTPDHLFNVKDYGAKGDGVTDDTVSIQNTINACVTRGGGTVFFPYGVYIIAGPIQTNVGGINYNSQLYLPVWDGIIADGVTVLFKGEGTTSPGNLQTSVFSTTPIGDKGAWLYSTYVGTGSTITRGTSVFGTYGLSTSFGIINGHCWAFEDLGIIVKDNPNGAGPEIGGINSQYSIGFRTNNVTINTDAAGTNRVTATRTVYGIETPNNDLGACYPLYNTGVNGFKYGFLLGEHIIGDALSAFQCYYGYCFKQGSHDSSFGRIQADWCNIDLTTVSPDGDTSTPRTINIANFDVEWGQGNTGTTLYNTTIGIDDPNNLLEGSIAYNCVGQGGAGGNNLFVINGGSLAELYALKTGFAPRIQANGYYNAIVTKAGASGLIIRNLSNANNAITFNQLLNDGSGYLEIGILSSTFPSSGFVTPGSGVIAGSGPLRIVSTGAQYIFVDGGTTPVLQILTSNQTGIRVSPTANLHIGAGAASANSAPLKIDSGTLMTIPENGAIEYDGTNLYFTVGSVRKIVTLT